MLHQSKSTSALPELNTKQGLGILNRTLPPKSVLVGNDSFPKEKVNFHHGRSNYGRNWDWDKPPATSNQHRQRSRKGLVDESLPPRMKPERGEGVAFVDPQVGDLLTQVGLHAHKLQFNRPKTAAAGKIAKAREGNTADFADDFGLSQPTASEPFTSRGAKAQTLQSQVYIKK